VFSGIKAKFKNSPSLYYAMSIAATWAGVGSLMNSIIMARQYGIVPFLLWALGNTLACIVFGIFAPIIPKFREVMRSQPMRVIAGFMSIFQVWLNMNGIQNVMSEIVLGGTAGMISAYAVAVFFIVLLWKNGVIRSVLTDHYQWIAVYGIAFAVTVSAIIYSSGNMFQLRMGLEAAPMAIGFEKCVLLVPGAFMYPYFYEILDYNDRNGDGTRSINVRRSFVIGGLLFGAYLSFAFLMAWTNFSPLLNLIRALLIALIAVSTISSFLFSIYITFGRKLGLATNIACIAFWQLLIPMGVMGLWTTMSQIRIWIVFSTIIVSFLWSWSEKRKAVGA